MNDPVAAAPREPHRTHEVKNQPVALENYNVYSQHRVLQEAVVREGAGFAEERLVSLGREAGAEAILWGTQANENPPRLRTHDRYGRRLDEVEFHPAWHSLMELSVRYGLHALPWREPVPGAHAARAAMFMTVAQVEAGHGCPISMTYSVVPALRAQPELAREWEPRFTSLTYDGRHLPVSQKRGALAGMALTEKQGGSDVRANSTTARPMGREGPGEAYELTGHKWFCSAPMCDAFLTLAQTARGLSCFLLPRFLPDGTKNRFFIQRLKDKLGNRSNASSEVEYDGAVAWMVGEEGRGVRTIIEMVNHTRLDCVLGSTALIRAAVVQALHHTSQRAAFGKRLVEQPLMQSVLADLCVESEAATLTAMRLAGAYDRAGTVEREGHFRRLATAVSKYWICKRAPSLIYEASECLGGFGYVEESGLPRLYREAPVNSIWEGSGNVICLDVLRAMAREPASVEAFLAEVNDAAQAEPRLARFVDGLQQELTGDVTTVEPRARRVVEKMALALQGALVVRHAHPAVAAAFCQTRLEGDYGQTFGTLPSGLDVTAILQRHQLEG
ncbi:MAG: isovaleryl-CoA dehydrogenase [Myxococcota bacterium]|nr:isovaleryl-CoA dehydrogenase [Myxococcota bacterium]